MSILETVKDVLSIAQKIDNIDLLKNILELQTQAYDLLDRNRSLQESNRDLEEKLKTAGEVIPFGNAYWKKTAKGVDGPFCIGCHDSKKQLSRLTEASSFQSTFGNHYCGACKSHVDIKKPKPDDL